MLKRIPVFQQGAVCLTKFGPESGETTEEILARKDLERRSGTRAHKNEFWWGIGEKGAAQSINKLISQHGANVVLFCAIKSQKLPENGSASDILVWGKYSVLGDSILHDIPKHVLITSAAVTKSGRIRRTHFAPLSFTLKSIQQIMGRPTPITWNHRVLLIEEHGEKSYCIHEVHYDEDGSVMGWTQNAIAVFVPSFAELILM